MKSNYRRIGDYIEQIKVKNTDGKCDLLLGINIDKFFMPSVANVVGTDLTKYKVVNQNQLVTSDLAYGLYKNYGVVQADEFGNAELKVRNPQSYEIKKRLFTKKLKPHIHYRYTLMNGIFSRVETVFI